MLSTTTTTTTAPRRLATALLLCWIAGYVAAQVQVRVDDDDPAIVYSPTEDWFRNPTTNPMDAGGFHQVTTSAGATATFRFTGTGISYMAPLFAEEITTQVRLDGGVPVIINLQDTTVPAVVDGAATVESSVLWSENGLTNTEHILVIEVAPAGRFAVVDMLVVEQDGTTTSDTTTDTNTETTPTTVDETTTSSSTRTRAAVATSPTASPTPGTTAGLTITIAVVCSVFGILFIIGLLLFLARRRRQRREREAWNHMNPPPSDDTPPLDTVDDGINAPPKQRFRSIPSRNGLSKSYGDESVDSMSQVTTTMASGKAASKLRQVVATEQGHRQSWVPPVLPPKNGDYEIVQTSRT